MTATFASHPWPMPSGTLRSVPWQFGREVVVAGQRGAPRALQWLLKRNCSITPRQLIGVYLSLCVVSLLIGGFFYAQGAPVVLAFTALELTVVGAALLVFARHAGDHESLTLVGRSLQVRQSYGSRIAQTEFAADWLTVEPAAGQGSLVELCGRGQTIRVGRFLRPELRAAFARELRLALRQAPATSATEPEPN
jgi:uncharacterized membrane protein